MKMKNVFFFFQYTSISIKLYNYLLYTLRVFYNYINEIQAGKAIKTHQ